MSVLDAVRRPEHTGDRRCWPCTAVNAVVVLIAAGLLATVRLPLGVLAALVGGVLIALRGYVVPYTPRFAPRLVAPLPVEFKTGDAAPRSSDSIAAEVDGERVTAALLEAGVLLEDDRGGLVLADGFRADWEAAMADLRDGSPEGLAAAAAAAAPGDATGRVAAGGDWVVVAWDDDEDVWLDRPVAIAETAAVRTLAERGVPAEIRAGAADPLRMFLATCPDCGGPVTETTVGECCGGTLGVYDSPETDVLACADCGAILHEFAALDSGAA